MFGGEIERKVREAVVDKSDVVASAALVAGLQLFNRDVAGLQIFLNTIVEHMCKKKKVLFFLYSGSHQEMDC
jgi:hypothetical protein